MESQLYITMSAKTAAVLILGLFQATAAFAELSEKPATASAIPLTAPEPKVKYKSGKDLSFDELLIEGQLKRGELNVVTGDTDKNGNGLLRLRENFMDRMMADLGEESP